MKNRLLFVPVLIALVVSLAACGGGSQKVPPGAVALVNGTAITAAQYQDFFAQAVAAAEAQGQQVTPGSQEYTAVRNQTVAELVELAEVKQQMKKEGVTVTPADIDRFIAKLVKTNYHGSQAKFLAAVKKAKLTLAQAKEQVFINLLATKIHAKVTDSAKVTPAQESQYYKANAAQFMTAAKLQIAASKKLANTIEQKLRNGASFAKLAKQYSQDPGSASQGGKSTVTKGQLVPAYQKAAFSLKTGELSAPIDATSAANSGYGFFIMKPLGPVKKTGGQVTRQMEHILVAVKTKPRQETLAEAKATIDQTLLGQQQQTLWQQWLTDLQNEYKGKVSYGAGYAPPTTTALSTAPAVTTG